MKHHLHHLLLLLLLALTTSLAEETEKFDYSLNGANWEEGQCEHGRKQSPINIPAGHTLDLEPDTLEMPADHNT